MTATAGRAVAAVTENPAHPLDPLSAAEIRAAVAVFRLDQQPGPRIRVVSVALSEPGKAGLSEPGKAGLGDAAAERRAMVVTYDKSQHLISEAVVSLTTKRVVSVRPRPGLLAPLLTEEFDVGEALVCADSRWQAAMRRRGITDFSLAMIDIWPSGFTGAHDEAVRAGRLARPLTWVRADPGDNGYARPVEGLLVTIDLDAMTVLEVVDTGVVPLPRTSGNYTPERMGSADNRPSFPHPRGDVAALEITQPDGPGFTVRGWAVAWQKWRLRVGFSPREGLILHQVGYEDRGRLRPVLHRASLSEMVVPYGDPGLIHWNKNVFDMGEVGLGFMANSLRLGCDCLGVIRYLDCVVNDANGDPVEIPQAICLHEEDQGIAWKHTDSRAGEVQVRRSRRLVISSISTVGNYEYGFYWYLYTDGTIEYEIKLTGIIATGAVPEGDQPRWGSLVAPGLYGPHHQHIFNVRLDMSVDGPGNRVYEVDSLPERDPARDPGRNAWVTRSTLLETEDQASRDFDYGTARYWLIANHEVHNELGGEVAYKLIPAMSAPPMFKDGSFIHDRARFAVHDLWVTAYDPDEMFAAGDYPYQSPGIDGLPRYAAQGRRVADADLVVWYNFAAHHVVRPEDWPVMPVTQAGFKLKPVGFFDGNPALDLPPEHESGNGSVCCH